MKAISLWNQKGGAGKTMFTIQIAGYYAELGKQVVIIDLDPSLSVTEALQTNKNKNITVIQKYPASKPRCDIFIADLPAGIQELPRTKTVIVPFKPCALDIRATKRSLQYLHENNRKAVVLMNFYHMQKSEHRAFKSKLQSGYKNFVCVKDRSIFERAVNRGVTIYHKDIQNLYGIRQAKADVQKIIDYL